MENRTEQPDKKVFVIEVPSSRETVAHIRDLMVEFFIEQSFFLTVQMLIIIMASLRINNKLNEIKKKFNPYTTQALKVYLNKDTKKKAEFFCAIALKLSHADRVAIHMFHNRESYLNRVIVLKMSTLAQYNSPEVEPIYMCRDELLDNYRDTFIALFDSGQVKKVPYTKEKARCDFGERGDNCSNKPLYTRFLFLITLGDGKNNDTPLGFLEIQYLQDQGLWEQNVEEFTKWYNTTKDVIVSIFE